MTFFWWREAIWISRIYRMYFKPANLLFSVRSETFKAAELSPTSWETTLFHLSTSFLNHFVEWTLNTHKWVSWHSTIETFHFCFTLDFQIQWSRQFSQIRCSEPAGLTLTSLVLVYTSPTGGRWRASAPASPRTPAPNPQLDYLRTAPAHAQLSGCCHTNFLGVRRELELHNVYRGLYVWNCGFWPVVFRSFTSRVFASEVPRPLERESLASPTWEAPA